MWLSIGYELVDVVVKDLESGKCFYFLCLFMKYVERSWPLGIPS
jgi:hypothetical protein